MTTTMTTRRSDLALEAAEALGFGSKAFAALPGVRAVESRREGYAVTAITVTSPEGEQALGKPVGTYVTVDLRPYYRRETGFFHRAAACLAQELRALVPHGARRGPVLVTGLGNPRLTADAVGPLALDSVLITRHMIREQPRQFRDFTPVLALATGVLGATGMETLETVRAVVRETCPAAVIAIDALAARSRDRLCATVQLSDTGLIPGSGVGNHRRAVNAQTLGVPVVAVGVPTVIDAAELSGGAEGAPLFVTPRDIDSRVRELSRIVGYGVTLALQPGLTADDVTGLLG